MLTDPALMEQCATDMPAFPTTVLLYGKIGPIRSQIDRQLTVLWRVGYPGSEGMQAYIVFLVICDRAEVPNRQPSRTAN